MPVHPFDRWFANYLRQDEHDVRRLLEDKVSTYFLIAWSLFEANCFNKFVKVDKFNLIIDRILADNKFDRNHILDNAQYFHTRYQDKTFFKNLMYKDKDERMTGILKQNFVVLSNADLLFFLLFVVYRYRNNIFHGNKGVESWIKFRPQINRCINVMQQIIDWGSEPPNSVFKDDETQNVAQC